MLRTATILSAPEPADGLRISIMSRHTLPDGETLDPRIDETLFDEHWAELAPHPKVVGAYYRNEIGFDELERLYLESLNTEQGSEANVRMAELARLAIRGDVTLMCIEQDPHFCHRRILAEEMTRRFPGLKVQIG